MKSPSRKADKSPNRLETHSKNKSGNIGPSATDHRAYLTEFNEEANNNQEEQNHSPNFGASPEIESNKNGLKVSKATLKRREKLEEEAKRSKNRAISPNLIAKSKERKPIFQRKMNANFF